MAETGLFDKVYTPDVLTCLANLSNDEVFTPPEIVNQMLDMLPQELFSDPNTTFLDPACKTGVFLREIAKRLNKGLESQIPDLQERLDHIFHKQLYGIAITEMTSLLSRRSVYCSKYPNSEYSVSKFDDAQGNIRYKRTNHKWKDGRCVWCGANKEQYERSEDLETHAYEWIHVNNPEELFKVKFDVIIGNPPYQMSDGGGGAGKSAAPIYQKFVSQAIKLQPSYLTMIIPSRWFNGGKGLDDFRLSMLGDDRIALIYDYSDSKDCFPGGVDIPGGICYFLWDKKHSGACKVINALKGGRTTSSERSLSEYETFIRNNDALSIVRKVTSKEKAFMNGLVSSRKPFGLESNTPFDTNGDIVLRSSSGLGTISRSKITAGENLLDKWKVIASKVSFEHAGVPDKDGMMRVLSVVEKLPPTSACTESYLVIGSFDSEACADNLISYLNTKFVRVLLMQMLASMNMSKSSYSFVPIQDFSKPWTDDELYSKYDLSMDEIDYIEATIKPMPNGDSNE